MSQPLQAEETRSFTARTAGHYSQRVTMRLEWIDCGKQRCRRLHGPYWYAYQEHQGRTFKVYVGTKYDERKAVERLREKMGA